MQSYPFTETQVGSIIGRFFKDILKIASLYYVKDYVKDFFVGYFTTISVDHDVTFSSLANHF
tara:strand:- start:223 stop:408 length:186 start_codon:yes stop_codon:yes gene_type:complete